MKALKVKDVREDKGLREGGWEMSEAVGESSAHCLLWPPAPLR